MAEALGGEWHLSRSGGREEEEVLRAEHVPLPFWGRLAASHRPVQSSTPPPDRVKLFHGNPLQFQK